MELYNNDKDPKWKKSGQIPEFGNWERANDLPITQYFESARQAGLIRYSSSSGECNPHQISAGDLYAVDHHHHNHHRLRIPADASRFSHPPPTKTWVREKKSGPHVKEQKMQGKISGVIGPPRKPKQPPQHSCQQKRSISMYNVNYGNEKENVVVQRPKLHVRPPKPVDEDLYKIPPELLQNRSSKRKKMRSLFSCLAPVCAS